MSVHLWYIELHIYDCLWYIEVLMNVCLDASVSIYVYLYCIYLGVFICFYMQLYLDLYGFRCIYMDLCVCVHVHACMDGYMDGWMTI